MSGTPRQKPEIQPYSGPAGGWGSAKSVTEILLREHVAIDGSTLLSHQNKPEGYMCVSVRLGKTGEDPSARILREWGKGDGLGNHLAPGRPREILRCAQTGELERWPDHDLEEKGRLTDPMRWDASDKPMPVSWASGLRRDRPRTARVRNPIRSNSIRRAARRSKRAYMYQLFARMYGSNICPTVPTCATRAHPSRFRKHRRLCRHRSSVGFPEHRLHLLYRAECRNVVAAPAA
jgi:hypothetical protein